MFLLDGSADGRVFCELGNWTGKACKIPRHLLKSSADRKELYRAGVYFLFGRDETTNEIAIVYVGEAEEIYPRYRFERDVLFVTPSSAAGVVLGRSANDRVELIDEAGRTLKWLEESP